MRLHQARAIDFRRGKRLGFDDRLATWVKPAQRQESWSEAEFAALPATLAVRLIRLRVAAPGFRTRTVVLATTLLDPVEYPADTLRALYGKRWQVEGHFFQLKESLALDVLRCKSPHLIEREVAIHQIAYHPGAGAHAASSPRPRGTSGAHQLQRQPGCSASVEPRHCGGGCQPQEAGRAHRRTPISHCARPGP